MLTIHRGAIRPVPFGALSLREKRIDAHLARTETPAFRQAYEKTFENARQFIQSCVNRGQKGFIILDIDETTLDNRGYFADPARQYYKKAAGLQSIAQTWQAWVNGARIPVIPEAKHFIGWLNSKQVPYVFLTGIRENLRQGSIQSLERAGVWGDSCLGAFYRQDGFQGNTAAFKRIMRPQLEQTLGLPILATIGDQPGDMIADPARNFQLPEYVRALRKENDLS